MFFSTPAYGGGTPTAKTEKTSVSKPHYWGPVKAMDAGCPRPPRVRRADPYHLPPAGGLTGRGTVGPDNWSSVENGLFSAPPDRPGQSGSREGGGAKSAEEIRDSTHSVPRGRMIVEIVK